MSRSEVEWCPVRKQYVYYHPSARRWKDQLLSPSADDLNTERVCYTCAQAVMLDKGRWCRTLARYVRPGFHCAGWAEEQGQPDPDQRCHNCRYARPGEQLGRRWCRMLREHVRPAHHCRDWEPS